MQGWRISMEDAHTAILDLLAADPEAAKAHQSMLSFFGVFDGHGGDKVALFAGKNIQHIIAKQDTFKKGEYEQSLKDGFLATDRAILNGMTRLELLTSCARAFWEGFVSADTVHKIRNMRKKSLAAQPV
jgi:protein phosphatase PTC2/3